jgi:hypothetical protein
MVSLTQRVRVSSTGLSISLSLASLAGAAMPGGPRPRARPGAPRARGGRGRGTDGTPAPWGPASEVRAGPTPLCPASARPRLARAAARGPGDPLPCTTHLTALTARRPRVVRGAGRGGRARARARARAPLYLSTTPYARAL